MTAETIPQHMEALTFANEVRSALAAIKAEIREDGPHFGPLRVAHLLCLPEDERPPALGRARIYDLVKACPRWGRHRVLRLLAPAGVPERKTVGEATARQRQAVADALDAAVRDRLTRSERMTFERQLRDGG